MESANGAEREKKGFMHNMGNISRLFRLDKKRLPCPFIPDDAIPWTALDVEWRLL